MKLTDTDFEVLFYFIERREALKRELSLMSNKALAKKLNVCVGTIAKTLSGEINKQRAKRVK